MRALLLIAVLAVPAYAELPPGSYDSLRFQAQEALILEVASVRIKDQGGKAEVALTARVLKVERSKSGLKKGRTITIRYEIFKGTAPPGPRPLPVLRQGEIYPAFLDKKGAEFDPAAYGESFTMTPEGVNAPPPGGVPR